MFECSVVFSDKKCILKKILGAEMVPGPINGNRINKFKCVSVYIIEYNMDIFSLKCTIWYVHKCIMSKSVHNVYPYIRNLGVFTLNHDASA